MKHLTLEDSSFETVLVGSFNPFIFQPSWFLNLGFITSVDQFSSEENQIITTEVTRITLLGLQLTAMRDRLIVFSPDQTTDSLQQDLLSLVLTKLNHTPIRAAGINCNVHFSVSRENYQLIGEILAPKDVLWNAIQTEPKLKSIVMQSLRKDGPFPGHTTITIQQSPKLEVGIYITINYHFDVPSEEEISSSSVLKFISQEWATPRNLMGRVMSEIDNLIHTKSS